MRNCDREAFINTNRLMLIGLLKISLSTQKESQKFVLSALFFLFSFGLFLSKVQAQIVPDSTLPVNSLVIPSGNVLNIEGGTRAGNNLFHSFQEFSVPTGIEAFFHNTVDVRNIFSRVTGKSISNIDGLIRAKGAANLFLLNPNGIIFGPNARLNIGGSFLGSTANSIKFGDGIEFSATNPQATPLLSVNVPIGLQYGKNAGEIRIQGNGQQSSLIDTAESFSSELNPLEVGKGQSLSFVGGNVIVEGGILRAPDRRVELGGLAGEGTVGINADGSLSFPNNLETPVTLANVTINNQAGINVLGDGGGSITINANNLDISGNSLLSAGIATSSKTVANAPGDITFNASQGIIITSSKIENNVNSAISLTDGSQIRNGGNINIKTGSLFLSENARLNTTTYGQGNAGNVKISATDIVSFDREAVVFSNVGTGVEGEAGGIEIFTKSLFVTNGAELGASTFGKGNAGSIKIFATDTVLFDGVGSNNRSSAAFSSVASGAIGKAVGIEINTGSLFLTNGARLTAGTFGQGEAGIIKINASDQVFLDGVGSNSQSSGVFSNVEPGGIGEAGGIAISTKSLQVRGGAAITASTFGNGNAGNVKITANDTVSFDGVGSNNSSSGAFSTVASGATGKAGGIEISTGSLSVTNGAQLVASTFGNGKAGSVKIAATDTVTFDGVGSNSQSSGAFSTVESQAVGDAGGIFIETGSLFLKNGAQLQTLIRGPGEGKSASEGDRNAGIIDIEAKDLVSIEGNPTGIFSTVEKGASNNSKNTFAGNIFKDFVGTEDIVAAIGILAKNFELKDGARLSSSSSGTGNAGAVVVIAEDSVTIAGNSSIFSSVTKDAIGDAGAILIGAKSVSLTSSAGLNTTAAGKGNAGLIGIIADSFSMTGGSTLQAQTSGTGDAGFIILLVNDAISLAESSYIFNNVEVGGEGNGGKIGIFGRSLSLKNGSQIQTLIRSKEPVTDGQRSAGNIVIQVSKDVSFSGFSTRDLAGNEGRFPSAVFSTADIGNAGSITISARSIRLDQGAYISAEATNGTAGSIDLKATNLIVLRNGQITTTANESGGGGNITVNTNGLVAIKNSDIIANAGTGSGGKIAIDARSGSLGIEPRTREELEARRGTKIDSQNIVSATKDLRSSDVTAISGDPALDGTVTFNTAVFQVIPLNQQFALPPLVPQACRSTIADGSEFIITGKGGLPINPIESIADEAIWIDVRVTTEPSTKSAGRTEVQNTVSRSSTTTSDQIIEAQGWKVNSQGEVVLIADTSTAKPQNPNFFLPQECQQQ